MLTKQQKFHFSPRTNKAHLINWHEWGKEAFEKAKNQGKPVLLSISATWCHWCHVMDETSYSDEKVIGLINGEFIPIRVDTDQRPDVNRRYNIGGWPTTVVLTPTGEILQGGTYIPPHEMYRFLKSIHGYYKEHEDDIYNRIMNNKESQALHYNEESPRRIPEDALENTLDFLKNNYDEEYGGFGIQPKFPQPDSLSLLFYAYYRERDEFVKKILETTLTNMARSGMYDQVEGGFFRYSTTRDWSIPHYEKMLEDNAALLGVYTNAYLLLDKQEFLETAKDITRYLVNNLFDDEKGVFWGSQDADEKYYALKNLEDRRKRPAPFIDKTIYADWNSMGATAFIKAAFVLKDRKLYEKAFSVLEFIVSRMFDSQKGVYHFFKEGKPHLSGILKDQVYSVEALLNGYFASGNEQYFKKALELGEIILESFYDRQQGVFVEDKPDFEVMERMGKQGEDVPLNGKCCEIMLLLYHLTLREEFKESAQSALECLSASYLHYGGYAAPYARAVELFLKGAGKLTIVGDKNKTMEYVKKAFSIYVPFRILEFLDPIEDRDKIKTLGYEPQKESTAFYCDGKRCFPPITSPNQLDEIFKNRKTR